MVETSPNQKYAFEEIYTGQYEKVYNFCLRMVFQKATAEELTQETFARVYEKLASFRGQSSISTWVHTIAYNACMDYFRQQQGWRGMWDKLLVMVNLRESTPLEKTVIDRHVGDRHVGMEILTGMTPKSRSLLILRQCVGLDYEELANIFNTTVNSIGVMLNRARKEAVRAAERKGIRYEM